MVQREREREREREGQVHRTRKPLQFLLRCVVIFGFISHTFLYELFWCIRHHKHKMYIFFNFKINPVKENCIFVSLSKLYTEYTIQNNVPHYVCARIARIHPIVLPLSFIRWVILLLEWQCHFSRLFN